MYKTKNTQKCFRRLGFELKNLPKNVGKKLFQSKTRKRWTKPWKVNNIQITTATYLKHAIFSDNSKKTIDII